MVRDSRSVKPQWIVAELLKTLSAKKNSCPPLKVDHSRAFLKYKSPSGRTAIFNGTEYHHRNHETQDCSASNANAQALHLLLCNDKAQSTNRMEAGSKNEGWVRNLEEFDKQESLELRWLPSKLHLPRQHEAIHKTDDENFTSGEILERISIYVPAWIPSNHSDSCTSYYYHPQDLVACSLVSRTWYHIFYRQLWTVFDGEAMSGKLAYGYDRDTNKPPVAVPEELLAAHSSRFLIFTNYNGRIGGIFQCRQLIDLTLHIACPRVLHLVRMNPGLKRLTWYGSVPYSGLFSDLESYALSYLGHLEELTLKQWDVSEGRLLQTLRNNSNSLVKLTLWGVQGLDTLTEEMDNGIENCISGEAGDSDTEKKHQGLVLEQLMELTVDCEWVENRALLDFITRCCPNIERLQLGDELVSDTWMMNQLDAALAETHPMLKRVDSADSPRRYSWGARYKSVAGC